ncbi:hypothetical protein [Sphingobacterium detergens]
MAVQIIKQPNEISWSRNPIYFEFSTDQVIQDQGRPLIFSLDFSPVENTATIIIIDDDQTIYRYEDWGFTLSIGQTRLPFSCEYGVNPDKFMLPHRITDPQETKASWLERVKNSILQAYNIGSMFYVQVVDESLLFTSSKNDSKMEVKIEAEIFPHPLLNVEQTAVDITYTPNLKIYVELIGLDIEGNEQLIASAALVPNLNGVASWDFSKLLSSFVLDNGDDIPSLLNVINEKGKVVRSFFVQVTELYGEPQTARMSMRTEKFVAVYGGLPKNLIGTSLTDFLLKDEKIEFLTTSIRKTVTPDQPQWISWLNISDDVSNVNVIVELEYLDGTINIIEPYLYDQIKKYEKIIVPVGLEQLGANAIYPELAIVSYSIYLKSQNDQLSTSITVNVDHRHHPYKRFFLFQNSLGSFETFFTYGKKSNSLEVEKDSARLIQVKDFTLQNGENIDLDITINEKEKINTGFKTKIEILAMRDFYLSKDKLIYTNEKWWPINLISSSIEEFQDGNSLYAQTFEISGQHLQEMFYE